MTQDDYARTLDELDRLLNDPDVKMDPARVWSLLAEMSGRDTGKVVQFGPRHGVCGGVRANGGSAD